MFQFTHPVWGATPFGTHRAGGLGCFNSRTPCGVRRALSRPSSTATRFQFTHPVWGATAGEPLVQLALFVSIHAPRVGCDSASE